MAITLRAATFADVPQIEALIARSARGLSADDYRPSQVEGALRGAFGVDTQLLIDRTYFAVEEHGRLVGCGGWSFRSTLFGGDARADRDSSTLDPSTQAAKVRAFFVDPDNARRGIGTLLLEHCEKEARARGFSHVELMPHSPASNSMPHEATSEPTPSATTWETAKPSSSFPCARRYPRHSLCQPSCPKPRSVRIFLRYISSGSATAAIARSMLASRNRCSMG